MTQTRFLVLSGNIAGIDLHKHLLYPFYAIHSNFKCQLGMWYIAQYFLTYFIAALTLGTADCKYVSFNTSIRSLFSTLSLRPPDDCTLSQYNCGVVQRIVSMVN